MTGQALETLDQVRAMTAAAQPEDSMNPPPRDGCRRIAVAGDCRRRCPRQLSPPRSLALIAGVRKSSSDCPHPIDLRMNRTFNDVNGERKNVALQPAG